MFGKVTIGLPLILIITKLLSTAAANAMKDITTLTVILTQIRVGFLVSIKGTTTGKVSAM